jgi:Winged helix-turn-helix DNA-binding
MKRISIIVFLVLFSLAYPSFQMVGSIDSSGVSSISMKIELPPAEGRAISVTLSGAPDSLFVRDRSGLELVPRVSSQGNGTVVSVDVPYDFVQIDMASGSFTSKNGSDWDFDFSLSPSEPLGSFNASIGLPKGAVVRSSNGAVQASGDSIIVTWSGSGLDSGHRMHLRTGYSVPVSTPSETGWFLPVAVLAVLAGAAYLISRKKPQPGAAVERPTPREAPAGGPCARLESNPAFATLDETDKDILRELCAQGGKTTQARLYLDTHVPKATLSRRLSSLEGRGMIRRSQKGNRNLVTLGDTFSR